MLKCLLMVFLFIPSAFSADFITFDMSSFNEEAYLRSSPGVHLLPLIDNDHPFDDTKEPIILVHGIRGKPSDMQPIADLLMDTRYQPYVLVYDDFKTRVTTNGALFAEALSKFNYPSITIIAYSMGGIITRKALADMIDRNILNHDMKVNFFAIDTPWHGFDGPGDEEAFGLKMGIARLFLPDGLEDMRAKSEMFEKLNQVKFPSNIKVRISFAEEGEEASDYTEGFKDSFQQQNFYNALKLSEDFNQAYPDKLPYYFPRFPGDHMTVLHQHDRYSFLDYLKDQLL